MYVCVQENTIYNFILYFCRAFFIFIVIMTEISPGGSTPQSSSCKATYYPSQKLSKLDELDMQDTAGEVGTST